MMMRLVVLLCGLAVSSAMAQYTNSSSVLDGSGIRSAGGSYTNLSAAGQPGGISESTGGGFVNQAGFLNTFFLKPTLDSDGDGIPDEIDTDNDNDGLADTTEISGTAFAPTVATLVNVRDSDGDGQSDGQEAAAGTDPLDPAANLRIVTIGQFSGQRSVTWLARSNKTYKVYASDSSYGRPTNLVVTVTANGSAAAPWYATTNTLLDAGASSARFYAIEAQP